MHILSLVTDSPTGSIYTKGDSNPNDKYVLSERALVTMNFDTSIIKIGRKNGEVFKEAFKEFVMANI